MNATTSHVHRSFNLDTRNKKEDMMVLANAFFEYLTAPLEGDDLVSERMWEDIFDILHITTSNDVEFETALDYCNELYTGLPEFLAERHARLVGLDK